ncbi:phenylacetate--CoA ligase family protein [Roseibaca sp. Y0-43]|uniref:phenylacetate--CoA ligase family protein n=1 Tax=Roseibaca sp. Y0-43 TaxID=2816854 RepID=UPI001D0C6EB3|nr:AMP-binding protein [Roseibaca sp. Y0-43]MCC1482294.1 AMP-binding protein [Roseibaca sp. Y0-43]
MNIIEHKGIGDAADISDDAAFQAQIAYLLTNSEFYRGRLNDAGITHASQIGGLSDLATLPFTEKNDLRASRTDERPLGTQLACAESDIARIYSTSGTTGTPSFIPLTARDVQDWVTISSRSYSASGVSAGDRVISSYNAGPFVAGAALGSFDRLGLCHIPVGTGNTERLVTAIQKLRADAVVVTPSYALHLIEWAAERGIDLAQSSVQRVMVAGEPGGGEPEMRATLEAGWGAKVTEAMGIGDIAVSLWGECEHQKGMHFGGAGFVHVELIDPDSGATLPMEDGAEGELVYTHLRQQAAPLLRFRSRDHVRVTTSPCPCGRHNLRVRCIGRTDDMLIVRGVNVFPTAIREVVSDFTPDVSGVILITPTSDGAKQEPPLPVKVEMAPGKAASDDLAKRIEAALRAKLVFRAAIELVPHGSLPRSQYKSKLIQRAT